MEFDLLQIQSFMSNVNFRWHIYDYDGYYLREETDMEIRERIMLTPSYKIAMMECGRY